jgi:hypothetical protein
MPLAKQSGSRVKHAGYQVVINLALPNSPHALPAQARLRLALTPWIGTNLPLVMTVGSRFAPGLPIAREGLGGVR